MHIAMEWGLALDGLAWGIHGNFNQDAWDNGGYGRESKAFFFRMVAPF
jgi:hypothetical protein